MKKIRLWVLLGGTVFVLSGCPGYGHHVDRGDHHRGWMGERTMDSAQPPGNEPETRAMDDTRRLFPAG